jgi:hypothetical protein
MRHQSITTNRKSSNDVIADFVVNLKDYDGLSFSDRMMLSQVKIKCLVHGSSDTLSDEELNCASSALARSTAAWDLHA